MADQATVKQLSATGRHQECLQACQNILQGNPEEAFAYKYAGKSLLTLGQLEKAHQCLAKAHQLDQTDPETAKDIGNSYLQLQDIDNARKWYQAALVINKGYAPAIFNLASLDNRSGNHKSAIALFKQAIAADPNLFQALLGAASSAMALGQVEQAIVFASNALEINPNTPKAHELLGIAYQNTGQQEKAIEHYQKEISRNATAITSLTNYGLILLQNNDVTASIKLLKQASEIGANEQITLLLAQTYQQQRQWTNAIAEYEKLNLEITKNKLIPFNYGLCLMEVGISDKAIEAFKTAIKLDQAFVGAWGNIGAIYKREGQLQEALEATKKTLLLDPKNATAYIQLGGIYQELGSLDLALTSILQSLELNPDNPNVLSNLGLIYKDLGNLEQALASTLKSLELKADNPGALRNLGLIYKDLGNLDQALTSTLKSLELKPDNHISLMNLGGIYKDLGSLDQALTSTLKSLELKPDNPGALMNLGLIYKDLGNLDQALTSTLKSLELRPDNPVTVNNLKGFIGQLTLTSSNADNLKKAYELLLNLDNVSHQKLSRLFILAFLPTIQEAATLDPIISANNDALNKLAADWRLKKSLALLIPSNQDIERFLTRLRKELLILATTQTSIPEHLKPLSEAVAIQCFLNEYVYVQSPEEDDLVEKLIVQALQSQELFKQYLAIIACYIPIHKLNLNQDWLKHYPTTSEESTTLIQIQLEEPKEEEKIKASIQSNSDIDDVVSLKVQDMYEENPYPRYRHADYTDKSLAKTKSEIINIESTKHNLQFSKELNNKNARPKVLIAGCGTGGQVILASRYKNAQIKAIDLSSRSLAYAIRKAEEYGMENIDFKMMDLLDVANLQQSFDIIECSGVLHHMENPGKGLSALNEQLKPGGYIKLGLYSDIARQQIVEARNQIKELELQSTPEGIREFRQQVLRGEFTALSNLPQCGQDFYSLSGCRDLCFHVQEHRFTTESLQELLNSQGLIFCGFMLPEPIRKTYQKQFPNDTDMISLENWG
ncbi:class I SAM-dependent methyltransferase, partial [Prochlorococcus marinus]|uniref:class I SAM-dependent methyltransferase n=1 Tax=Prochlorococcus marinus TaxID=1219 RepID=UPI0007B3513A